MAQKITEIFRVDEGTKKKQAFSYTTYGGWGGKCQTFGRAMWSSAVKVHAYRPSYSNIGISSKEVITKIYLSGYTLLEHHYFKNLKINKPHKKN